MEIDTHIERDRNREIVNEEQMAQTKIGIIFIICIVIMFVLNFVAAVMFIKGRHKSKF